MKRYSIQWWHQCNEDGDDVMEPKGDGEWARWEDAQQEITRLREALQAAREAIDAAEEINPSNYDHDLVCQLNSACNQAYTIIVEALEEQE